MNEDKTFSVNVYTPQALVLSEQAEAVTCRGLDGEIGILKNHTPCVIALQLGVLKFRRGDAWDEYLCSEGFMEVYRNRADVYVDFCRKEADLPAALAALERQRRLDAGSVREHWENEIRLSRVVGDLKKPRTKTKRMAAESQ